MSTTRATARAAGPSASTAPNATRSTASIKRGSRFAPRVSTRRAASSAPVTTSGSKKAGETSDEDETSGLPSKRGAERARKTRKAAAKTPASISEEGEDVEGPAGDGETQDTIFVPPRPRTASSNQIQDKVIRRIPRDSRGRFGRSTGNLDVDTGIDEAELSKLAEGKDPGLMTQGLSDLWKSGWKIVKSLAKDADSANDEQLTGAHDEFRKERVKMELKEACNAIDMVMPSFSERYIDVFSAQLVMNSGVKGNRLLTHIPNEQRVDEVLYMGNLALTVLDAAKSESGLQYADLDELDGEFPQPFMSGFGKGIGQSDLCRETIVVATSLRIQTFIHSIESYMDEASGHGSLSIPDLLKQSFYNDPSATGTPTFRGWNVPGLRSDEITGELLDTVKGSVDGLTEVIDRHQEQSESYFRDVWEDLTRKNPPEVFKFEWTRWLRKRAREIKARFEDRHDEDDDDIVVGKIKEKLKASLPKKGTRKSIPTKEGLMRLRASTAQPDVMPEATKLRSENNAGSRTPAAQEDDNEHTALAVWRQSPHRDRRPMSGRKRSNNEEEDGREETVVEEEAEADEGREESEEEAEEEQMLVPTSSRGAFTGAQQLGWFNSQRNAPRMTMGDTQSSRDGNEESDEEEDFEQDLRPHPTPQRSNKRRREEDEAETTLASPSKRQRQTQVVSPRREERQFVARQHSLTRSSSEAADEIASERPGERQAPASSQQPVPSQRPARPGGHVNNGRTRVAWSLEEDQVLLDGIELFGGAYGTMSSILDPEKYEEGILLKENGRTNADLTNRARILAVQYLKAGKSLGDMLKKIPLKEAQVTQLLNYGLRLEDIPNVSERRRR